MTLTFTLTVNGKHLLRLPDRKELCGSKQCVCSIVTLHISIFLLGMEVEEVGEARRYIVLLNGKILLKYAVTSPVRFEKENRL